MYREAGIDASKVRQSGTRNAEKADMIDPEVDRSFFLVPRLLLTLLQLRKAGRWNSDTMTGCYQTGLPRGFMRAQAGFDPLYRGSDFVPRATVKPPPSLLRCVWPSLDVWADAHFERSGAREGQRVEVNRAAGAFLELLEKLREVFLQVGISTAYGLF
jgi:hypothetical protein